MKIHLCSDLHLEFGQRYMPEVEADTIIVAGDVSPNTAILCNYLTMLSNKYSNVLFVAGNHDYYRNDIAETDYRLCKKFEGTNVHFLQNDIVEIDGVTFYGGTMWTDAIGNHDKILEDSISDFHLIKGFSVPRMREVHKEFKASWQAADVVITHHVPDVQFTHQRFVGSALNGAFSCTDMKDCLHKPKFWCFGHTHDSYNTLVGNTRFLCNPLGYPTEYNNFNPELIFEL